MVIYLLVTFLDYILAAFVWYKRRDAVAMVFVFLAIACGTWSLELFFLTAIKNLDVLMPLFRFTRPGMFFIAPLLLTFVVLVTRTQLTPMIFILVTVPLTTSAVISLFNIAFFPSDLWLDGYRYAPVVDTITVIHRINFVFCGLMAALIALRKNHQAILQEKIKYAWLTFAILACLIFGFLSFDLVKYVAGTAVNIICLMAFSYVLLEPKLPSLATVLTTASIRAFTVTILSVLFFIINSLTLWLVQLETTATLFTQTLLLAGILEVYPRLNAYLLRLRDRYNPRAANNHDVAKSHVEAALHGAVDFEAFKSLCDMAFIHTLNAENYQFHLSDKHFFTGEKGALRDDDTLVIFNLHASATMMDKSISPLNQPAGLCQPDTFKQPVLLDDVEPAFGALLAENGIDICSPLRAGSRTVGFITLGSSKTLANYDQHDLDFIAWLSIEFRPALEHFAALQQLENKLKEAKTPLLDIASPVCAKDLQPAPAAKQKIAPDHVQQARDVINSLALMLKRQPYRAPLFFDLNTVLSDVVNGFPAHDSQIDTNLKPLPRIAGNTLDIQHMLSALLTHTHASLGKPHAVVKIETWFEPDQEMIACRISDNGIGMRGDFLTNLFDHNEIHPDLNKETVTRLLGAKRAADAYNGIIRAESVRGLGTRFTVFLPKATTQNSNVSNKIPVA